MPDFQVGSGMPPLGVAGPSRELMQAMIDSANHGSRILTEQRDNLRMQLDGACRRVDELEGKLSQNALEARTFQDSTTRDAERKMQTMSQEFHAEMATMQSRVEHEAKQLRQQFVFAEQNLTAQHREQANSYQLAAQAEVQQMKLQATSEHHTAQAATQALGTARTEMERYNSECGSLRTQLSEAHSKMAAAAATGAG